jgi:hypothetical protein
MKKVQIFAIYLVATLAVLGIAESVPNDDLANIWASRASQLVLTRQEFNAVVSK